MLKVVVINQSSDDLSLIRRIIFLKCKQYSCLPGFLLQILKSTILFFELNFIFHLKLGTHQNYYTEGVVFSGSLFISLLRKESDLSYRY